MKGIVYLGPHRLELRTIPRPCLESETDVIVKVAFAGICGSDITIYEGRHPRVRPPVVLGHEFSGTVAETGGAASGIFAEGQKVVVDPTLSCGLCPECRRGRDHLCETWGLIGIDRDGAFTQYVTADMKRVIPIPGDITLEEATLAEPAAVAIHAVKRARITPEDSVLVIGAGPIGVLAAQASNAAGAAKTIITDISEERVALAAGIGLDAVLTGDVDIISRISGLLPRGRADVIIDAAGTKSVSTQLTDLANPRGRIVIVALYKEQAPVGLRRLSYKEIEMLGSCTYSYPDFYSVLEMIKSGRIKTKPLITDIVGLKDAIAFIESERAKPGTMKVLINPQSGTD